jgi:hypothetical protein
MAARVVRDRRTCTRSSGCGARRRGFDGQPGQHPVGPGASERERRLRVGRQRILPFDAVDLLRCQIRHGVGKCFTVAVGGQRLAQRDTVFHVHLVMVRTDEDRHLRYRPIPHHRQWAVRQQLSTDHRLGDRVPHQRVVRVEGRPGPRRGFPRSTHTRHDRIGRPLYPGTSGVHTTDEASRPPLAASSNGKVLHPGIHPVSPGLPDEASQRIHSRSPFPIFPSPGRSCGRNTGPWASSLSFAPQPGRARRRTSRRGPTLNTDRELPVRHSRPPHREFTHARDFRVARPPDSYPDRTHTGKRLTNQPSTVYTINHQPFWTHRAHSMIPTPG